MTNQAPTNRQKLINQVRIMLGDNLVDVELNPEDYHTIVDITLDKYRQRASNATEESLVFLNLKPDQSSYILPSETMEVRQVIRRSISSIVNTSTTSNFDAFDVAFTNMYVLHAGGVGGLLTYDLYTQQLETLNKMFGGEYNYTWDSRTKKLTIIRAQKVDEDCMLWVYNYVPEEVLLTDTYAYPWIRDYAVAQAKKILGQAYEKFSSVAGPQGGFTLNGSQLKAEALAELDALEEQLRRYQDGSDPLGFFMG